MPSGLKHWSIPPRCFYKWPCTLIGSKPNSPKSYNLVEDDGLSSYCRIWNVVCTCACYYGDGKRGGDHPIIYGFGDIDLYLCLYYACARISSYGACCSCICSTCGPYLTICSIWQTIANDASIYTSSWGCCCLEITCNANTFDIEIVPFNCILLFICKGFSSSSSSKSTILCCPMFCPFLSNYGFYFGDLLNDARGRLRLALIILLSIFV